MLTAEGDGGVEYGEAIVAFVDATMKADPVAIAEARERLSQAIGDRGVVDTAAVAAMFQLNTRAADAAGVPIEEPTRENRSALGEHLGFDARSDGQAP